jgi:hypothetical protein
MTRHRQHQPRSSSDLAARQQPRYFTQPNTFVPPRGGRVELIELRPVRPNQDIILPTMVVMGRGIKFEVMKQNEHDHIK